MAGRPSLLDDAAFDSIGKKATKTKGNSNTVKIVAVVVMFAVAGLLIAYTFGVFDAPPPKPANVAQTIDDLPPEQAAEAKRIKEQTERDLKAGRVVESGS